MLLATNGKSVGGNQPMVRSVSVRMENLGKQWVGEREHDGETSDGISAIV